MGRSKLLTTKEERILYWLARGLMTNDMGLLKMAVEESHNHFVKKKIMKIENIQDGEDEKGNPKVRTQFTLVNTKVNKEMMKELETWCKARGVKLEAKAEESKQEQVVKEEHIDSKLES